MVGMGGSLFVAWNCIVFLDGGGEGWPAVVGEAEELAAEVVGGSVGGGIEA